MANRHEKNIQTARLKFLSKFEPNCIKSTDQCWIWPLAKDRLGYGYMTSLRSLMDGQDYPHRISYRLFRGEIAAGMTVDHLCRNTSCVNPNHLEAVSLRENIARARPFFKKFGIDARRCRKRGHDLSVPGCIEPVGTSGYYRCAVCRYYRPSWGNRPVPDWAEKIHVASSAH